MIRAPTYAIRTTRRYGSTKAKKIITAVGSTRWGSVDSDTDTITGTDVTEARAAITAYRGSVGTTTLKIRTQTATHDRPIQSPTGSECGCRNSAVAIP